MRKNWNRTTALFLLLFACIGMQCNNGEKHKGTKPVPDIAVVIDTTILESGDTFNFGKTVKGAQIWLEGGIANIGNSGLQFTGTPQITIEGDSDVFSFTKSSSTELDAGWLSFSDVKFLPPATGKFSATVKIESNDPDEGTFVIFLTGEGIENSTLVSEARIGENNSIVRNGQHIYISYYDIINKSFLLKHSPDDGVTWETKTIETNCSSLFQ